MHESREVGQARSTCEAAEQAPREPAAEAVEGRGLRKGNAASKTRPGLRAGRARQARWIACAEWHRQDKDVRFTALLHHVDVDRLRAAYWAFGPKAAPGVDGVTWRDYGQDLEENLRDLHARVHRGQLPGEAVAEGVHTEGGRAAAAARDRRAGGQDPSAGGGRGAERDLRQAPDNRHEEGNERFLHRSASDTRWPRAMRWRPARAQRSVGQGCTQAGY